MPETIVVVVEQREGKLNRVSWETLAAGQALAQETGWTLAACVVGAAVTPVAQEIAAKKLSKVFCLESPALGSYTPDGYSFVLERFLASSQPHLVLMPHTYQVRDFVPKLATAIGRTVISDCIGYRKRGEKLLFTRQMFQGKFAVDVSFRCEPPWFVTFQNGAFRADKVEAGAGAAPIETSTIEVPGQTIRARPQEVFKEAKQALDLTQAKIIVSVGRGIKEQKNIDLAKQLAEVLGGELAASRPICDAGWLPMDRQIGSSGQTVAPQLYVALGISGAIQHIVGMKGARSVVAINTDAEAPIFEIADIAVSASLFDVVPVLIEEIKKTKMGA
ncbi:MAG: electron transfer flavoprotein subunit alpha/FixB family protein [Acidobacteria bacterium]|nr:electron transfer flavoprotein subunit alpha/FixB family protein [Acidobacteriota bacterium]